MGQRNCLGRVYGLLGFILSLPAVAAPPASMSPQNYCKSISATPFELLNMEGIGSGCLLKICAQGNFVIGILPDVKTCSSFAVSYNAFVDGCSGVTMPAPVGNLQDFSAKFTTEVDYEKLAKLKELMDQVQLENSKLASLKSRKRALRDTGYIDCNKLSVPVQGALKAGFAGKSLCRPDTAAIDREIADQKALILSIQTELDPLGKSVGALEDRVNKDWRSKVESCVKQAEAPADCQRRSIQPLTKILGEFLNVKAAPRKNFQDQVNEGSNLASVNHCTGGDAKTLQRLGGSVTDLVEVCNPVKSSYSWKPKTECSIINQFK
ncbi:hypothetical protein EBZ37_09315 [bacterium]|nr:hypothetical protein [bacterium]